MERVVMKLRVHSWGGLGSQLFALSLLFELKKRFPSREMILIHHTSGVSRRLFELDSILDPSIKIKTIDDYKLSSNKYSKTNHKKQVKTFLKKKIKSVLEEIRLSINYDQNNDFKSIKPWTIMIRGHYSDSLIGKDFYSYCIKKFKDTKQNTTSNSLIIHYRLGDLIDLPGKSIIPPENLIEKVKLILKNEEFRKIIIYSDSIDEAQNTLSPIKKLISEVEYSSEPTIEVIRNSINAKYFVGTNSKVSIWIIKFRDHLGMPGDILKS
jgi:hypothetical protein